MNKKVIYALSVIVTAFVLARASVAIAGSLSPLASPAPTFYTLANIYTRLTTNETAAEGSHSFSPGGTPAGSLYTLKQIYESIPTINPAKLLQDTTYLGVTGTIAIKSGEAAASSSSTSTQKIILTPQAGYYDGSASVSTTSINFTASNISTGVNIFGITGTLALACATSTFDGVSNKVADAYDGDGNGSNRWCMAASSNSAAASDIISGKKAWVDGQEIVGTYSPVSLSAGYPGSGFSPNPSGDGSTALSQAVCEAAGPTWQWFEDANGDGDTSDPEDGECVKTTTVNSDSWNGAEQLNLYTLADTTATEGAANSITVSSANWPENKYANEIIKIISGTASGCWGLVKSNTATAVTVYGSWLQANYTACAATPDSTSHFQIYDDNKYDNSWIGDYSCTGNFPSGSVVLGSYPSAGTVALAVADCYDGKRDLLPNETDRSFLSGTVTATSTNVITDSNIPAGAVDANAWMGQKVLITSGTGSGSWGIIESNTAASFTVGGWSGAEPDVNSEYKIIYLIPRTAYINGTGMSQYINGTSADDAKQANGPLTTEVLKNWKGSKLPTSEDFVGFCGYKDGGSNYENTTSALSSKKTYGNYGSQVGRTDEFMDLANSSYEWLAEPHYYYFARVAGGGACSLVLNYTVYNSYRFRAVFRP